MRQAVYILNRFSDEFVAAILEHQDTDSLLEQYVSSYPEMEKDLRENALYLSEVYGYLQNAPLPSQQEANNAYSQVKAKIGENPASIGKRVSSIATPPRWQPSSMLSWLPIQKFSNDNNGKANRVRQPAFGLYLSGALGVAIALLAVIFWNPSNNSQETATQVAPSTGQSVPSTQSSDGSQEYAVSKDGQPQDSRTPFKTPSELRGEEKDQSSLQEQNAQKIQDDKKMSELGKKGILASPSTITIAVKGSDVDLSWASSEGALSYVIELKENSSAQWQKAKVVPITKAKLTGLSAGKYSVRITATAGEKQATPGKASTFTVE